MNVAVENKMRKGIEMKMIGREYEEDERLRNVKRNEGEAGRGGGDEREEGERREGGSEGGLKEETGVREECSPGIMQNSESLTNSK